MMSSAAEGRDTTCTQPQVGLSCCCLPSVGSPGSPYNLHACSQQSQSSLETETRTRLREDPGLTFSMATCCSASSCSSILESVGRWKDCRISERAMPPGPTCKGDRGWVYRGLIKFGYDRDASAKNRTTLGDQQSQQQLGQTGLL
jgi:hypothetical protein